MPNSAYKVLSRILFFRLRPLTESFVGEYQAGFRQGRSTTDQIFTLRQILDKFREYNLPTHHLFVNFRAAYDSVKSDHAGTRFPYETNKAESYDTGGIKIVRADS